MEVSPGGPALSFWQPHKLVCRFGYKAKHKAVVWLLVLSTTAAPVDYLSTN